MVTGRQKEAIAIFMATTAIGLTMAFHRLVSSQREIWRPVDRLDCRQLREVIRDPDYHRKCRFAAADRLVTLRCVDAIPDLIDCVYISDVDRYQVTLQPHQRSYPFEAALLKFGDDAIGPIIEHLLDRKWDLQDSDIGFHLKEILYYRRASPAGLAYLDTNERRLFEKYFSEYERRWGDAAPSIWQASVDSIRSLCSPTQEDLERARLQALDATTDENEEQLRLIRWPN